MQRALAHAASTTQRGAFSAKSNAERHSVKRPLRCAEHFEDPDVVISNVRVCVRLFTCSPGDGDELAMAVDEDDDNVLLLLPSTLTVDADDVTGDDAAFDVDAAAAADNKLVAVGMETGVAAGEGVGGMD